MPNKPAIDIGDYHCAAGHSHEVLLRKTAEQQGIVLEGKMLECIGCSMAKGLRKGIKTSTLTRADEKLGMFVLNLSELKVVEYLRRKRYTLIVHDEFSLYTWSYFLRHKSDAAELFEQFLADTRADGVSSKMVIVRSDGVAERALGLIETAVMAGRIQIRERFPGAQLPATES